MYNKKTTTVEDNTVKSYASDIYNKSSQKKALSINDNKE